MEQENHIYENFSHFIIKTEGSIHMCGVPIENTKEIRNMVGYLPQDFSMYPNMTVYKAMDYLAVLSDIPLRKRRKL